MPGFSRRSRSAFPRSQRRKTFWDDGPLTTIGGQTSVTVEKVPWATGAILATESMVTLVRTRGEILIQLDLATAAGDGFAGALGIGIVSGDAAVVGATAMPGPFSDADWPGWLWHQYFHLRGVASQSQGQDVARNSMADLRIQIDSKAQRIIKSNETVFGMLETASETGTAGLFFVAQTRILSKLA